MSLKYDRGSHSRTNLEFPVFSQFFSFLLCIPPQPAIRGTYYYTTNPFIIEIT